MTSSRRNRGRKRCRIQRISCKWSSNGLTGTASRAAHWHAVSVSAPPFPWSAQPQTSESADNISIVCRGKLKCVSVRSTREPRQKPNRASVPRQKMRVLPTNSPDTGNKPLSTPRERWFAPVWLTQLGARKPLIVPIHLGTPSNILCFPLSKGDRQILTHRTGRTPFPKALMQRARAHAHTRTYLRKVRFLPSGVYVSRIAPAGWGAPAAPAPAQGPSTFGRQQQAGNKGGGRKQPA